MRRRIVAGGATVAAVLLAVTLLGGGSLASRAESAAAAVTAAPVNTSPPTITGTTRSGQTLTASAGTWTGSGSITYAFQWQRCNGTGDGCANVADATSKTYALSSTDVGSTIRVAVTATNSDSESATAYSSLVGPVAPDGKAPSNTQQPTITGSAQEGATLAVHHGSWTGSQPIRFAYVWFRCNTAGNDCVVIAGPGASRRHVLGSADVGHPIVAGVQATNSFGTQTAYSKPTPVVVSPKSLQPAYSAVPAISGTPTVGQRLTVSNGTWSGATPMSFAYQWGRCNSDGTNCAPIPGATANGYTLVAADTNHIVLASVTARNAYGTKTAYASPTRPIQPQAGATIAVQSVSLPDRLVVSAVSFAPARVGPGASTFTGRFRVTDSHGNPVSGVLVYAIALPYGRVANAPEVGTDGNGYATIPFRLLHRVGQRRGSVVFFVRARKPGDSLLAGVSTRRLVQVATGR